MAIKTLIVDDEELCRRGVRLLLAGETDFKIVGESSDGKMAIRDIISLKPDLVFLDIQMPEVTGFDVINSVGLEDLPLIVFVTAYDEYAIKAFEVHALDYILKPFSKKRFRATLRHVKESMANRDIAGFSETLLQLVTEWKNRQDPDEGAAKGVAWLDRVFVNDRNALKVVWVKDIEWIEGADYYVSLHCSAKSYLYRERMKNLEKKLPPADFFRIHKSAIINMHYLDRIVVDHAGKDFALMNSGARVKISKNRKKDLLTICKKKFGLK